MDVVFLLRQVTELLWASVPFVKWKSQYLSPKDVVRFKRGSTGRQDAEGKDALGPWQVSDGSNQNKRHSGSCSFQALHFPAQALPPLRRRKSHLAEFPTKKAQLSSLPRLCLLKTS